MFHDQTWKPIYFGVRRSRVTKTVPAWIFALLWVLASNFSSVWFYLMFHLLGQLVQTKTVMGKSLTICCSFARLFAACSVCEGWRSKRTWKSSENGAVLCSRIWTKKRRKLPNSRPTFSTLMRQRRYSHKCPHSGRIHHFLSLSWWTLNPCYLGLILADMIRYDTIHLRARKSWRHGLGEAHDMRYQHDKCASLA